MIEIFKTDVNDPGDASRLIAELRSFFSDYEISFDLEDCDKILRVKSATGKVQAASLIDLLKKLGCHAEVLPDSIPLFNKTIFN
jgi:hypothetical protein